MAYSPGFSDATNTASIAANATSGGACTSLGGASTFIFQLSGTWSATVQVQLTRDGTNWVNVTASSMVFNAATGASITSGNVTANGIYTVDVGGAIGARLITTAYTSGPIVASTALVQNPSNVTIAGTAVASVSGTATVTPVTTTPYVLNTAATTNAAAVKASAGNLYSIAVSNPNATAAYIKLFNKTTAPTLGTDVPVLTLLVPASNAAIYDFGTVGLRFATGIAIAVTGAIAAADATATVAGIQIFGAYV